MPPQSSNCIPGAEPLQSSTNHAKSPAVNQTSPNSPGRKPTPKMDTPRTNSSSSSNVGSSSTDTKAGSVSPPVQRRYIMDPETGFMFPTGLGRNQRGSLCPGKNGLWSDGDPMPKAWAQRGIVWAHDRAEDRDEEEHVEDDSCEEGADLDTEEYEDEDCGGHQGAEDGSYTREEEEEQQSEGKNNSSP